MMKIDKLFKEWIFGSPKYPSTHFSTSRITLVAL